MKTSLRFKTIISIFIIATIISVVSIFLSGRFINFIIEDNYKNKAEELTYTIARVIDVQDVKNLKDEIFTIYNQIEKKITSDEWGSDEFNAYVSRFDSIKSSNSFNSLLNQLRNIQEVNDVDCLYVVTLDTKNEYFMYMVDAALEDACPPGCLDILYEENREVLTNPERGFPAYFTETDAYGRLVTAGAPIYDKENNVIGYAMADISLDMITSLQTAFTLQLDIVLIILAIIISFIAILLVNKFIIKPINTLSIATSHYNAGEEEKVLDDLEHINIKSQDEISSLYSSIKTMLMDIENYISNLKQTTQELTETKIIASEMDELAHNDLLSGAKTKLAYTQECEKLNKQIESEDVEFGIVVIDMNNLKKINDIYGHENGDIAIQKTCNLIYDTFTFSTVYRFGGDEFVIIVKDQEYRNVDKLVETFKEKEANSQGELWERVNAAIGYSLYDKEKDETVEDVFRRADYSMYEHKKLMKKK